MNQRNQKSTNSLVPVRAVREGSPYRVPRHPAPLDLMLDGNEGLPPSVDLWKDLAEQGSDVLFRYPNTGELEQTLTQRLGLEEGQLLVTAGSDDGIDRICRAMLSEGREALVPWPTFEMMARYASVAGGDVTKVPWVPGQSFPVDAMIQRASSRTGLLMIVSPNNPTGSVVTPEQIVELSQSLPHVLILLDLAYIEFADIDLTYLALELPNVAVTRTLSKAWGMAGLRIGYVVSSKEIINWLRVAGEPYAVAGPSLFLANQRLSKGDEDVSHFLRFTRGVRSELEALLSELGADVSPSQGNFVFAQVEDSIWFRDAMAGMGIGVRVFPGKENLENSVRMTCPRNPAQAKRVEKSLRTVFSPEAILFDMDGVLADVSQSYRQAILQTAEDFGVTLTPEDVTAAKEAGNANNDWIVTQRLLQRRGKEVPLDEVVKAFELRYQGTLDRPGLWEKERLLYSPAKLRDLAQRYRLGIVTGRPREDAMRFLDQFALTPLFQSIVCMEDAPAKPNPQPVALALQQMGVERAWMIGDTPDDIRAARAAGVLPLGVVAPGDNTTQTAQVLLRSGAACVLESAQRVEDFLP